MVTDPRTNNREYIFLSENFSFLKREWKLIFAIGIFGLTISALYLFITPNDYEASAIIDMKRIAMPDGSLGPMIEEPKDLIARMGAVTSYESEIISDCGFEGVKGDVAKLLKQINLIVPRGTDSKVQVKVSLSSSELAKSCIKSLLKSVDKSQNQMLEAHRVKGLKKIEIKLQILEKRLEENRMLLAKIELKKDFYTSPIYFPLLTEIRAFEDQRAGLIKTMRPIEDFYPNKLSSIIVADENPVQPKRARVLLAGLICGVLFGIIFSLSRQVIQRLFLKKF